MVDDGNVSALAANLPDDLIVEILSRLPVRSLCCCKCVSRSWRDLISHRDHRRKLAHTVSGFFFHLHVDSFCPPIPYWSFTALPSPPGRGSAASPPPAGVDPAFPFLPSSYTRTDTELLDSCNGLLLLRCGATHRPAPFYIVCNPTTGDWVELPEPIHAAGVFGLRSDHLEQKKRTRTAALAFDPVVSSSQFHVLQLVERERYYPILLKYQFIVEAVEIYSSETGRWVVRDCRWSGNVACTGQAAYHNGSLHFATDDGAVASVDTTGQAWKITRVLPESHAMYGVGCFVGRSQGRLLYVDAGWGYASLSVYALENRWGAERWMLKHCACYLDRFGLVKFEKHHSVVAIHPDGNVIFLFDSYRWRLMAYDMDRRTVRDIRTLTEASCYYPFFPYVPLYASNALSLSKS